jgi:hypothetical protein
MKAHGLEKALGKFVQSVGGETIPEFNDARCADFLFREQNVVAELKTLEEEARQEHSRKLQDLVNDWIRRGLIAVYGRTSIALPEVSPICQREWLSILQPPVENLIRDASRQIRSTEKRLRLTRPKGLLLIANQGNLLYTTPADYLAVVSRVLQKKTQGGDPRFPEINAVVYLSIFDIHGQLPPSWQAGFVDMTDHELRQFVNGLQPQWLAFCGRQRPL